MVKLSGMPSTQTQYFSNPMIGTSNAQTCTQEVSLVRSKVIDIEDLCKMFGRG
jgi:hypothetical protein